MHFISQPAFNFSAFYFPKDFHALYLSLVLPPRFCILFAQTCLNLGGVFLFFQRDNPVM